MQNRKDVMEYFRNESPIVSKRSKFMAKENRSMSCQAGADQNFGVSRSRRSLKKTFCCGFTQNYHGSTSTHSLSIFLGSSSEMKGKSNKEPAPRSRVGKIAASLANDLTTFLY